MEEKNAVVHIKKEKERENKRGKEQAT